MTEYECMIRVRVRAGDGDSFGTTTMVLPFAPSTGLNIYGIPQELTAAEVETVVWNPVKQCFWVYLEDDDSAFGMTPTDTLAVAKARYDGDWMWKDEVKLS